MDEADRKRLLRLEKEIPPSSLDWHTAEPMIIIDGEASAEMLAAIKESLEKPSAEMQRILCTPSPREPTDAMVKAGVQYALGAQLGGDVLWPDYIRGLYMAMEAAR